MRLDLADLRLFLCIVDAGSITQGAALANLALASASERLRNIEADVGVRLLDRNSRGVTTTEAGEALAHHARLILRQRDVMQGELHDFMSGARGTIRLYANTAALTEFLPSRLAPWLAKHPGLNLDLKERTSAQIVRTIRTGLAEAGVISDAIDTQGLELRPVTTDNLMLITPFGHPLGQARNLAFSDILNEPFVGLTRGSALQDHISDHALAAGRTLMYRIRLKTFTGICLTVSHGVGVAIVPQSIVTRYRRQYRYQAVRLTDSWARRHLCLCFRDWDSLSKPVQELLTHLGTACSELGKRHPAAR